MVTADIQSSGKGQYGKKWISNKGNLFVSFFHEFENINISLSKLTKINCLLVKKTIEIENHKFQVNSSIGVSVFPDDSKNIKINTRLTF